MATLLALHKELTTLAYETMERKNHDYAGASGETPFANFESAEAMGVCRTDQSINARLVEKVKRIINFSTQDYKVDEPLEETVKDLINFAILTYAWSKERQANS